MGDESTLQGLMDATETTIGGNVDSVKKIDPLVLFHPELSMDGLSQHGGQQKSDLTEKEEIKDEDCEIESFANTTNIKTSQQKTQTNLGKSMNFLNSVKLNKTTEAKERIFNEPLNFSGLFSKNNLEDEDDGNDNDNDEQNPMKRKSDEYDIGELYKSFVRKRTLVKYQSQSEVIW